MNEFYRPPLCATCGEPATRVGYEVPADLKIGLCDRCAKAGGYRACDRCGFDYAPDDLREGEGAPVCVYCVGERVLPFYED